MTLPNIGAVGGAAGQQAADPAAILEQNLVGAVGGAAAQLGLDPQQTQQLGGIVTGMMDAAASGDPSRLTEATVAFAQLLGKAAQSAQGGGAPAPASSPAPAGGPGGAAGSQPAGNGGGSPNPLDLLIQLLSALGVPPQMIEQIVNAVVQNAQSEGGGGAAQAGSAVPGVAAA